MMIIKFVKIPISFLQWQFEKQNCALNWHPTLREQGGRENFPSCHAMVLVRWFVTCFNEICLEGSKIVLILFLLIQLVKQGATNRKKQNDLDQDVSTRNVREKLISLPNLTYYLFQPRLMYLVFCLWQNPNLTLSWVLCPLQ